MVTYNAGTELRMLTRETIPCWYEFAFKGVNGKAELVLRIHADYAAAVNGIPDAPMIDQIEKDFTFTEFAGMFGKDIGFEKMLKYLGTAKDGFLEYLVPTPLCRKITDTPCEWCSGTGKDRGYDDEPCKFCEGGKDVVYDYKEAFAVCASLSVFLLMLEFPDDITTTATVPQLLTVIAGTTRGRSGCPLSGSYSRELACYLRLLGTMPIWEMEDAMRIVWERMDGGIRNFYKHSFSARTQGENGWLTIDCPGDATGLHPNDHFRHEDEGYSFTCHNLDNPMQQLCLLAALGALNYTARRDRGER